MPLVPPPNPSGQVAVSGPVELGPNSMAQMSDMEQATLDADTHICADIQAGNAKLGTGSNPASGTGIWGWLQNIYAVLDSIKNLVSGTLTVTATISGTASVNVQNWPATQAVSIASNVSVTQSTNPWVISGSVTTDTELPPAVLLSDTLANPTTPLIGSCSLLYNQGSNQFVRERSNFQSNTGDANKTATFTSQQILNQNAQSAIITIPVTATGVLGVVNVQLQRSYDSGSTWANWGAATGGLSTLNGTLYITIYVDKFASTLGGVTLPIAASMPMYSRVVVTCTGVLSGFNITNVYYEFIN